MDKELQILKQVIDQSVKGGVFVNAESVVIALQALDKIANAIINK